MGLKTNCHFDYQNKQTNKPLGFLLIKELLVYLEQFMFLVFDLGFSCFENRS